MGKFRGGFEKIESAKRLEKVDATKEEPKDYPNEIKAVWENPESGDKKEIAFDIDKEIKYFNNFYESKLGIKFDEKEIRKIWNEKRGEVKKKIETYGYDTLLIIPKNLPRLDDLNEKLIETMKEPDYGNVNETYLFPNLLSRWADEPFQKVRDTENYKTRIILTKRNQDIYLSGDPFLGATLNKNIMELTGLTKEEAENRINQRKSLPVNFEATINNKKIKIQTEGLNLEEYMVFQRSYFDKHQRHLDENGTTWLLKSVSGEISGPSKPKVVESRWNSRNHRLNVDTRDPDIFLADHGVRFADSFSS